jgi:hypothetical protein
VERLDLRLGGSDHGRFVFRRPLVDDLLFPFEAMHHERRGAFGMNEVNAFLRQLRDFFFDGIKSPAKLVFRAALEV